MARYTCSLTVAIPLEELQDALVTILQSCEFEIIHETPDCIIARETPGKLVFKKLVRAEVLVNRTTATDDEVSMKFVLKNEELALHSDNHCSQMFDWVQQTIYEYRHWQLLKLV